MAFVCSILAGSALFRVFLAGGRVSHDWINRLLGFVCFLDRQHELHVRRIGLAYKPALRESALTVLLLLGEDMALVSMLSFDLAASSDAEPLLGTGISLHFWHGAVFKEGKDSEIMGFRQYVTGIELAWSLLLLYILY